MRVMHRLAVELRAVFRRMFTSCGRWPVIALAIVQVMIDVSVEVIRTMKPRTCADEYTASEPLRPIVTIRRAVIRRYFVVPVRTDRRFADTNRNLRLRAITVSQNHANSNSQQT